MNGGSLNLPMATLSPAILNEERPHRPSFSRLVGRNDEDSMYAGSNSGGTSLQALALKCWRFAARALSRLSLIY